MLRPIVKFGHDVLHRKAAPVEQITTDLQRLIDDMIETMYAAPGVGLAAPQVGVPLRIFVVDISVGRRPEDLLVFVNPEFVEREGMQLEEEGCLSVPGFVATVARPARAVVKGLDRHGVERTVAGTGLLARALQHEMDHLSARLLIDMVGPVKRQIIKRKMRKENEAEAS
jgi:peptide deformylase